MRSCWRKKYSAGAHNDSKTKTNMAKKTSKPAPKKVAPKKKAAAAPAKKAAPAKAAAKPAAAKPAAAKGGSKTPRYFEFSEGSSNKFWEVSVEGNVLKTRYGKIGASGATTVKDFGTAEKVQKEYDKIVAEKTKKGYEETTPSGGGDDDEDDDD